MKDDTRGVAPLIGVILLFGMLIIGLSMFQSSIVPQQNAEVEFNHNERVQGDMVEFRDTIVNVGSNPYDESTEASATLGTQYPFRVLTINPPPAFGTVSTESLEGNIIITNKSGTELANKSTNTIQYEPQYREYTSAPTTTIEHTLIYNSFSETNQNITRSGEHIFQNDRVVIPVLAGEFSETDVDRISVSLSAESPQIEGVSENVTIRLPTAVPEIWIEEVDQRGDKFQLVNEPSDYIGEDYVEIEANVSSYELQNVDVGEVEFEAPDGPIRFVPGGKPIAVNHTQVHDIEDFANEVLEIPSGTDFGPEEGNNQDINYLFESYNIGGNLSNDGDLTLTSTRGQIQVGDSGSVINGFNLKFNATGPDGSINVDGATIKTTNSPGGGGGPGGGGAGSNSIEFIATGDISAVNTQMETPGDITIESKEGSIDLTNATITSTGGNRDITITAKKDITITDSDISSGGDIEITSIDGEVVD